MSLSKITKSLSKTKDISFPPVHLWNPELCEGQQISINREGEWFYNKSHIKNKKLVQLFSTVIRKDDNNYFLVTPSEKVPVHVDLAPYVITNFEISNKGIHLETNLDYSFDLNKLNSTNLIDFEGSKLPIIHVRNGIDGFFNRNIYYKLIDIALEQNVIKNKILYIHSMGVDHPLGKIA